MRKIILFSFLIVLGLVIAIVCIRKHRSPNYVTYFEPAIDITWGATNNTWSGIEGTGYQTAIDSVILRESEIVRFQMVFTEDSTIQNKVFVSEGTYRCRMKFGGEVYPYEIYSNHFDLHVE